MQDDNFNKTPHILLLFWRQFFTKIFTGKMILPMVLPVNQWYGKFSKLASLDGSMAYLQLQVEGSKPTL